MKGCPHVFDYTYKEGMHKINTYYFGDENIFVKERYGDLIEIKWCKISEDIGYRIRGITPLKRKVWDVK